MELFIEIEFKAEEFDKIDKVLFFLTNEGWETADPTVYLIKHPDKPKEVRSKKYKLRRII